MTELDQVQNMLAHFICADAVDKSLDELSKLKLMPGLGFNLQFAHQPPPTQQICLKAESLQ